MSKYIDVILPLPLATCYTYILPENIVQVQVGCRVIVPFGTKKYYTAIVIDNQAVEPTNYVVKEIFEVLDDKPVIYPIQLKFWQWIADYYLCNLGDVYKAALPSGMKLESETFVEYNLDFEAQSTLSVKEQRLLDLLSENSEQRISKLEKDSGIKNIMPLINSLLKKGALFVKEGLKNKYKPKVEIYIRLAHDYSNEQSLHLLLENLKRAPKQLDFLMSYLEISGFLETKENRGVLKKKLSDKTGSLAPFSALKNKGVLESYVCEIGRLNKEQIIVDNAHNLNKLQFAAYEKILSIFQSLNVCLLYGVTSCGKTEIYIHLIQDVLSKGKQALFLLPEIALTTQITERLRRVFGTKLGIYHSKFSDAERVEIWQKQLSNESYDIIIGVRSSIFLPFKNLGLIIVDEEHDSSYKQQDPSPRYNARNAAIVLASYYQAKVLLGTATPSIESFYNTQIGKYGLVEISERYKSIQLPKIEIVDCKELKRKKFMRGPLSPILIEKMKEALNNREQIILFQNRRGYASFVECKACGWVPKCKNCDVSLTYHKGLHQLTCHYCGYTYRLPDKCPSCASAELEKYGLGTERVEDFVAEIFPGTRIARMDLDTTRSKYAYEQIISEFSAGKIDILIGTQMVAKGLDFDHVSVVGILSADSMMNYPDFRAYEKAFQLMVQVSGRAGRKNKQGVVILQTKDAKSPLIKFVETNDFIHFYNWQLSERQMFQYPPFYRLIYVYIKHKDDNILDSLSYIFAENLRKIFGKRLLGPDRPPVSRIQLLYIRKIILKIETNISMKAVHDILLEAKSNLLKDSRYHSVLIYFDVDPI